MLKPVKPRSLLVAHLLSYKFVPVSATQDYSETKLPAGMTAAMGLYCLFPLQVRQQFDVQLDQIARIKSRLADRSGTATSE